jgi:two-component system, NarL family, sensor histidine kinase DesK
MESGPYIAGQSPPSINWWPMVYAAAIIYLPANLLIRGSTDVWEWAFTLFVSVTFIALIAAAVVSWHRTRPFVWIPAVLLLSGAFLSAFKSGGAVFFFIACAILIPWAVNGNAWRTAAFTAVLLLVQFVIGWMGPAPARLGWWVAIPLFCVINTAGCVWIVRMTLSLRELARLAVREQIASDLNERLGDALAAVATRAERARRRLIDGQDAAGAAADIAEAERISRQTLSNVRQAIRSYRTDAVDLRPRSEAKTRIRWWPMVFAIFVFFIPYELAMQAGASTFEWIRAGVGSTVFVALIAVAVAAWQRRKPFVWVVGALTALALVFSSSQHTAAEICFAFAASIIPWAVNGDIRRIVRLLLLVLAAEFLVGWFAPGLPGASPRRIFWWFTVPVFSVICAIGHSWIVRTSLKVHELAQATERERIARDLHDVLGHTLSLLILKTELAGRLLERVAEPARVHREITDIEHIARQALANVRRAIGGHSLDSLEAEFERAASTLRTAGIAVECSKEPVRIDSAQEGILGLALREAVTNVIRHARAKSCRIGLSLVEDTFVLEVRDDGCGSNGQDGSGLRGMRERIEAQGGQVLREVVDGTRLTVRLPARALHS